jgi:hypothetical protein
MMHLFFGEKRMGNRETWNHAQESQQAQFGDAGRLARAPETPLGFSGELSKPEKEHVLLSGAGGAEALKHEQLPAPETHRALPERQASSIDFQEYKRLKDNYPKLVEKNERLIEENNKLWAENTRLNDALKELQELKENDERRKELQRQRAAKWREEHPETHRARSAEAMRKIRAEAKQQAESA